MYMHVKTQAAINTRKDTQLPLIRETQIKRTRNHLTPIRLAKVLSFIIPSGEK